jgi:uncharacterized protein DUF3291
VTKTRFQLAQVNIGRTRGEMTDRVMAEFVARLPEVNALADQSSGIISVPPPNHPCSRRVFDSGHLERAGLA